MTNVALRPVDNKTLVHRFYDLPDELQLEVWEWVLRSPRVININFQRGRTPDTRRTWYFGRDHVVRLTYPALLLDYDNRLIFQNVCDFNRAIKVKDGDYSIDLELSLTRDIIFLQSFHHGQMFHTPSTVDSDSHRMLQLKRLRRVMVLAEELEEILSIEGYPEYTWCETRLFGPIGHRDCQVERYIVLLDNPQAVDNFVNYHDLLFFSEHEMLTILSSPTRYGWNPAAKHPDLETRVWRIAGAWNYWTQRGHIRLPKLQFARLRQCLLSGPRATTR
ncbi:hypothetical protein VMCG_08557 [Cytospora schulzeri]|uniref:2EXR domain-containing protein n=1 Tax=Cytospora schulzeri TaxID=448051 RepID=A0A423VVY0_9PEZI|nr:hypothetical protein VMCG_08557 [Valsa malicola]